MTPSCICETSIKMNNDMKTKENSKRRILSDEELKEVSGGAIILSVRCGLIKEKEECKKKGCAWNESGECRNK